MNGHLEAWLDPYLDDELQHQQKMQVEAHLSTCERCRGLLNERLALSALLRAVPPAAGLKPVDQFVSQVGLRLERRQPQPTLPTRTALKLAWQFLPIPLLLAWGFIQAVFILSILVGIIPGGQSALLQQLSFLPSILPANPAFPQAAGSRLDTAGLTPLLDWNWLTGPTALLLVGLTYICWLASWWAFSGSQRQTNTKLDKEQRT